MACGRTVLERAVPGASARPVITPGASAADALRGPPPAWVYRLPAPRLPAMVCERHQSFTLNHLAHALVRTGYQLLSSGAMGRV
jgi:hypothetical protein